MIANYVITFISAASGYFCAAWVTHWWTMRQLDRVLPEFSEVEPIRGQFTMSEADLAELAED